MEFLEPREWQLRRPVPEPGELARAVEAVRAAAAPIVVAGGGVLYSGTSDVQRNIVAGWLGL